MAKPRAAKTPQPDDGEGPQSAFDSLLDEVDERERFKTAIAKGFKSNNTLRFLKDALNDPKLEQYLDGFDIREFVGASTGKKSGKPDRGSPPSKMEKDPAKVWIAVEDVLKGKEPLTSAQINELLLDRHSGLESNGKSIVRFLNDLARGRDGRLTKTEGATRKLDKYGLATTPPATSGATQDG